jgi:predicted nucleic acid-binding protein
VILADSSVWIDHLRRRDLAMDRLLRNDEVIMHPFVLGEVALGHLPQRAATMEFMRKLPQAEMAGDTEVVEFIERYELFGTGLGYVDVHLLTGVALTFCALWTRDKRLHAIAKDLGIAAKGLS